MAIATTINDILMKVSNCILKVKTNNRISSGSESRKVINLT